MPEMDDFFSIPQELLGMMARFADDSGLAANEIVGEALRDYLHRQAGTDLYAILSAADTRIRQSPVLIVTMDAPRRVLIVKSPLQYQYRPALKYHVEINLSDPHYLGRVSVVLRSNDLHVQRRFFINEPLPAFAPCVWHEISARRFAQHMSGIMRRNLPAAYVQSEIAAVDQ